MKATCTTISGRTQCARRRGSPFALVNGVFGDLERVEPRAQVEQQLGVEAGADLAGEHEIVLFEVADQQRAQADARALRIGEAADDELLRRLALHLQPVRRAAVLVRRVAPLGDDALPSLAHARSHGFGSSSAVDALQRRLEAAARAATRGARSSGSGIDVAAVEPQRRRRRDTRPASSQVISPSRITFVDRQAAMAAATRRNVLRQPIAREQPDVGALLEREQADAVELALEDPFRSGEALLGQRRRHRFDPVGKGSAHPANLSGARWV